MKRLFLVITEKKRHRGKITYQIGEIINNELTLIHNNLKLYPNMNRGLKNEAINYLVTIGYLPNDKVTENGYINPNTQNYNIIMVSCNDIASLSFDNG